MKGKPHNVVTEIYRKAKAVIDFNNQAIEGINYEGAIFDCVNIVGDNMAASDDMDLPVPSYYKVDRFNYSNVCIVYCAHCSDFWNDGRVCIIYPV